MADGRGRLSGLIPLVVVVVIVVLFARSCFDRLDFSDDEREPENSELGQGQVFDEDGDEEPDQVTVPEIQEADLEAMLEPWEPECPAEEGEDRHLQWTEPPPMCIDEDAGYLATLVTSRGDIEIELDVENAPTTVNNFVFLARWGYYDNTEFHAVLPDDYVEGGFPLGVDGSVTDPGYAIEDELPSGADAVPYPRYSVAMGNAGEANTSGGVFSLMMADDETQREPIYSRFGEITDYDSRNVVNAIEDTGRRRVGGDGTPSEPTLIHEVVITES